MTVQAFRDLLSTTPFRPFRLVLSGGDRCDVRRADLAFLTSTALVVGIDVGEDGIPENFKSCPLQHVAAVEPLMVGEADGDHA
jgi:hypothetical protein